MKLIASILFVVLATATAASDVSVRRVLSDHAQEVKAGETLRFWREVCVEKDVRIVVLRTIRDLNTDPEQLIKLASVEYGGLADDGCQAAIYELVIPKSLEKGIYVYEPVGFMDDGRIVYLPDEKFKVVE